MTIAETMLFNAAYDYFILILCSNGNLCPTIESSVQPDLRPNPLPLYYILNLYTLSLPHSFRLHFFPGRITVSTRPKTNGEHDDMTDLHRRTWIRRHKF